MKYQKIDSKNIKNDSFNIKDFNYKVPDMYHILDPSYKTLVIQFSFRLADEKTKKINTYKGFVSLENVSEENHSARVAEWTSFLKEVCGPCEFCILDVLDKRINENSLNYHRYDPTKTDRVPILFKVSMYGTISKEETYVICFTEAYAKKVAVENFKAKNSCDPNEVTCNEFKMISSSRTYSSGKDNLFIEWTILKRWIYPSDRKYYAYKVATYIADEYCVCFDTVSFAEERQSSKRERDSQGIPQIRKKIRV